MEISNPSLNQFRYHNSFVDSSAHGLERNLLRSFLLEKSDSISNVVAHPPLSGYTNLILINRRLSPWLLYPLVSIHIIDGLLNEQITDKNETLKTSSAL